MLLSKIKVLGHSMEPTIRHQQEILVSSIPFFLRKPKVRDIVMLQRRQYIIKRIVKIKNNQFYVVGDNDKESTDSRNFGWIDRKEIIGKVIYKI